MIQKFDKASGARLLMPTSYATATQMERDEHCNGMGPKGLGFLVPDSIYFMNMEEPGNIHDWMYTFPEGRTKEVCDEVFLANMYAVIDAKHNQWGWVKWLRKRRARKYYHAVRLGGNEHFAG